MTGLREFVSPPRERGGSERPSQSCCHSSCSFWCLFDQFIAVFQTSITLRPEHGVRLEGGADLEPYSPSSRAP